MSKHKKFQKFVNRQKHWFKRHPYWSAFFLGFAYFSIAISWMFTIKTAEIAQGIAVKAVAFSAGLIMVTSFALGFVIFLALCRGLGVRLSQPRALFWVPVLWLTSEYLRAIIFSISSLGPGGRIGPYWTFGNFGYYLAQTPLAYMSRFGGLYLLSGVVALLVVATYQSKKRRSLNPLLPVVLVVVVVSAAGYLLYAPSTGPTRDVAAVSYTRKDQPMMYSSDSHVLLNALPENSLDVLVLPEYSHYFEDKLEQDSAVVRRLLKSDDGLVIHSARENVESLGHNMLSFQAADGKMLNQQEKWFVVPAGEFVPYIYQVVLAYAGQERLLLDFNNQKSVNRGEKIETPYTFDGVSYGAHACSGVMAPDFYNQLAQAGADVLTNSAALDTMGITPLFHVESKSMNQVTAIAHAKPFVQSAKGGPAYIIDKDGRTLSQSDSPAGGVATAEIKANNTRTVYSLLGDWVVYVSMVLIVAAAVWRRFGRD